MSRDVAHVPNVPGPLSQSSSRARLFPRGERTGDALKSSRRHISPARVEGTTREQGNHDPRRDERATPRGTNRGVQKVSDLDAADSALNVEDILGRFRETCDPKTSTYTAYAQTWKRFWETVPEESRTRRCLKSKKGHDLFVGFLTAIDNRKTRRWNLFALKRICDDAGLPWPMTKREVGNLLRNVSGEESDWADRISDADDEPVKPWAEGLDHERDPYLRLAFRLMLQYGWYPKDMIADLRWKNVKPGDSELPAYIAGRRRKTRKPFVGVVYPDVAEDLAAWKNACPNVNPDAPLLPGIEDPRKAFRRFERKHGPLKPLTPLQMRHWNTAKYRRMDDPPLAMMHGHTFNGPYPMRRVYDRRALREVLDGQSREYPNGAVGELRPKVALQDVGKDVPELNLVRRWKTGEFGALELVRRLEELQAAQKRSEAVAP